MTVLIDPSTGKSIQQRRRKSIKSIKSRDSSRESICESEGTSTSSKSKKKRRKYRIVDIEDIFVEFDPEKEFLWEMWKKYERGKLKKVPSEDLNSLSGDEGYHTKHKNREINIIGAKVKTSEFSLHKSVSKVKYSHSRKSSNGSNMSYTSGEEISTPERTLTPDPNAVPFSVQPNHMIPNVASPHQIPQPIEVQAVIETSPKDINETNTDVEKAEQSAGAMQNNTQGEAAALQKTRRLRSRVNGDADVEVLVLHRLPGEKLGMGLSVESEGGENDPVKGVFVESVTPGGAADRATGGTHGLCVGDEILEVNGSRLDETSYSETVAFFKEMPLRVMFKVSRQRQADLEVPPESVLYDGDTSFEPLTTSMDDEHMSSIAEVPNKTTTRSPTVPGGFELLVVTINKTDPDESLGLTVIPSYGSTSHFYQVRPAATLAELKQLETLSLSSKAYFCSPETTAHMRYLPTEMFLQKLLNFVFVFLIPLLF